MASSSEDIRNVLVAKRDRLCGEALVRVVRKIFPRANAEIASRVAQVSHSLETKPCDFLVSGVDFLDGDILDLLEAPALRRRLPQRIVVTTSNPSSKTLGSLHAHAVPGVFDISHEDPEDLPFALMGVSIGLRCWSAPLLQKLSSSRPTHQTADHELTPTERLVLALLGTGCDSAVTAHRLDLSRASVQSVRRSLQAKLHARHRDELIRIAVQRGLIAFTRNGVTIPGFESLLAARRTAHRRTVPSQESVVAAA